jgi:hypothetical protein
LIFSGRTRIIAALGLVSFLSAAFGVYLLIQHRYADFIDALCSSVLFLLISEIDEMNNVRPSSYIVSGEASLCFAIFVFLMFLDRDVPLASAAFIFVLMHLPMKMFLNGGRAFNGLIITIVTAVLALSAYCKFDIESPVLLVPGFLNFSGGVTAFSSAVLLFVLALRFHRGSYCLGSFRFAEKFLCAGLLFTVVRSLSVFMMFSVNGFAAPPGLFPGEGAARRLVQFCGAFAFFSGFALAASAGIAYRYCGISVLLCVTVYMIEMKRMASHALCKRTFVFEERKNNS